MTIKWILFDLDDTLHDYSSAARTALKTVFDYLYDEFGVHPIEAEKAYKEILSRALESPFTEDKPARLYRENRFKELFDKFSIMYHMHLDLCLDIYDQTLMRSLTLKDGAIELLKAYKHKKLKIAIVTEGPQDAQLATIDKLGLSPFIDRIFISSQYQKHKRNGLYQNVLDEIKRLPSEVIVIGDNVERDVHAAEALGIFAILVSEKQNRENVPTVSSLRNLIGSRYTSKIPLLNLKIT